MGECGMNYVKSEPEYTRSLIQCESIDLSTLAPPGFGDWPRAQEPKDITRPNVISNCQRNFNILDERQQPVDDASASPICPAPLCRQFWKAGDYNDTFASKSRIQNGKSYMHVHPKFLHSNATSHKWAFGAIAELLDNAIDEIHNGSSFVSLDKITNPRDGSPSLLIQDDGGGMDPEAIRRCMSFGFSDKHSNSSIGKYGNGFKTSTMRLGADVIVFSRHIGNRKLTQSIGFLSYTYLSRTGHDRIVVPMVDYEYNMSTDTFEPLYQNGGDNFQSNISVILGWSPYTTMAELMQQFDDIGPHGTKVIVFNLWFTNEGKLEFDFESDPTDIRLHGSDISQAKKSQMSEQHIGNQYRFSLRVYMSILYLRIPQNFRIILRGVIVEHHIIARDLKYPEVVMYKPQTGGIIEGEVITTIGFLKEAPDVNIHGFNVYHKNRLILPFWQLVNYTVSRGRGVVGVLEANFIEPTHNKQDFERTSLLQKLESRLKDMTWEYWDHHCGLIGYAVQKKTRAPVSSPNPSYHSPNNATHDPVSRRASSLGLGSAQHTKRVVSLAACSESQDAQTCIQQRVIKRKLDDFLSALGRGRRQGKVGGNADNDVQCREFQSVARTAKALNQQETAALIQENNELFAKCLQYEKVEEELIYRVSRLSNELREAQNEYVRMLNELQTINDTKVSVLESSRDQGWT
ncbi:hypothetical protein RND81_13G132500 [Saponaria officinalis]|uniref:Morc S5 domain-containing protein n=1 Tax=Saponaria officinalis TaxID=3572 RepID=A0AAW1H5D6_SAPOF